MRFRSGAAPQPYCKFLRGFLEIVGFSSALEIVLRNIIDECEPR